MARRAASVGHRPVAEKDDGDSDVWLRSTDLSGGDSTGFCARLNRRARIKEGLKWMDSAIPEEIYRSRDHRSRHQWYRAMYVI
jgi:hypothetical protein